MRTAKFAQEYWIPLYRGCLPTEVIGTFGDFYITWYRGVSGNLEYRLSLDAGRGDYGNNVPEEVRHPSLGRIILFLNEWVSRKGDLWGKYGNGRWSFQKLVSHLGILAEVPK